MRMWPRPSARPRWARASALAAHRCAADPGHFAEAKGNLEAEVALQVLHLHRPSWKNRVWPPMAGGLVELAFLVVLAVLMLLVLLAAAANAADACVSRPGAAVQ